MREWERERENDRQTDRQKDIQIDRQRQREKMTGRIMYATLLPQTIRHTDKEGQA